MFIQLFAEKYIELPNTGPTGNKSTFCLSLDFHAKLLNFILFNSDFFLPFKTRYRQSIYLDGNCFT